jgi:hypothetical protein
MPSWFRRFFPWLIELWVASVLLAFFVVRILGSSLGQRLLALARLRLTQ